MTIRFISSGGARGLRRSITASNGAQESEVSDPTKLAEILRKLSQRVERLEAASAPNAVEFEVVVSTAGATVSLAHNFAGPIRWYVVQWMMTAAGVAPTAGVGLAQDSTSTADTLVLKSYVAGRAVVRIERAVGEVGQR